MPLQKTAAAWKAKTAQHHKGPYVKRVTTGKGDMMSADAQCTKKHAMASKAKMSGGGY